MGSTITKIKENETGRVDSVPEVCKYGGGELYCVLTVLVVFKIVQQRNVIFPGIY